MNFYIDANNTDGSDDSKVDRVYPDGTRIPLSQPELPDWNEFVKALRNSNLFYKAYATSKTNLVVNVPFTLLLATLTSGQNNMADLQYSLDDLRRSMGVLATINDVRDINKLLAQYKFPFIVSA